jgi:hypothetical protein
MNGTTAGARVAYLYTNCRYYCLRPAVGGKLFVGDARVALDVGIGFPEDGYTVEGGALAVGGEVTLVASRLLLDALACAMATVRQRLGWGLT